MTRAPARQRQFKAGAKATIPKHILVVDDEPSVRRLLADLFVSEGVRALDVLRETWLEMLLSLVATLL